MSTLCGKYEGSNQAGARMRCDLKDQLDLDKPRSHNKKTAQV